MFALHEVDFPCKNYARNQVNKQLQSIDKSCWSLNIFNERAIVPFYNVIQHNKGQICFKEAMFLRCRIKFNPKCVRVVGPVVMDLLFQTKQLQNYS